MASRITPLDQPVVVMSGLPSALLAKWATPFDHETAKLKAFCELEIARYRCV